MGKAGKKFAGSQKSGVAVSIDRLLAARAITRVLGEDFDRLAAIEILIGMAVLGAQIRGVSLANLVGAVFVAWERAERKEESMPELSGTLAASKHDEPDEKVLRANVDTAWKQFLAAIAEVKTKLETAVLLRNPPEGN